jgi:hypothetical protein
MSRMLVLPCRRRIEGTSMDDITLDDFPPDRLADIARWRNDPDVNRYLRQGIRTLKEVQEWYAQYFARAENKLSHSTQFSGKGYHRSSKAARGEDLQVEHPGARR